MSKIDGIRSLITMKESIASFVHNYETHLTSDFNETTARDKCRLIMQEHGIYYH
ncbi:hypothetical protein HZA96_06295 [Candidatus Woesearchaeota archaeon]|nr:hypothetical protein [Candidatus Woesearchaeota archaeon]